MGVFARFTTAAVDAKDNIQGIVFKFYADTFYFATGPDGELDRSPGMITHATRLLLLNGGSAHLSRCRIVQRRSPH